MDIKSNKERFKKIRADQGGHSQRKFAELLHIKKNTIADIERGKIKNVSADIAAKIAEKFRYHFRWVQIGEGPELKSDNLADFMRTAVAGVDIGIDIKTLTNIIKGVEFCCAAENMDLRPDRRALAISQLYQYTKETGKPIDRETILNYLKLVT